MRCVRGLFNASLVIIAVTLPGCLSLGGKTVYSNESPQTANRLSALEDRVSVLEQAIAGRSPAPSPPNHPIP
jgi:hypothetical protein